MLSDINPGPNNQSMAPEPGPSPPPLSPASHHLHSPQCWGWVWPEVPARPRLGPHLLTAWRKYGRKLWLPASSRLELLPRQWKQPQYTPCPHAGCQRGPGQPRVLLRPGTLAKISRNWGPGPFWSRLCWAPQDHTGWGSQHCELAPDPTVPSVP